jgi:hypothetical protein
MKNLIYIISTFFLIVSCKKDQLKDEKAVFIGKWEWVHTSYFTNTCEGAEIHQEFTPATEDVSFELEFQKEGIFELRKNEMVIASFKTKFKEFNLSENPDYLGWYNFLIHFNNDKDLRYFRGLVNKDSIVTTGFEGFEYTYDGPSGCGGSSSHFIKKP